MPRIHYLTGTPPRLDEGGASPSPAAEPDLPVRVSLPLGYEPNYAYPLIVLFHGRGGNEEQVLRLVPHISQRNYISVSLRGPEVLGARPGGEPAFGWGAEGQFDSLLEDYLVRAIDRTRRAYHVHTERIYLAGLCEGATAAYRLGLSMPGRFGGVVALNGSLPRPGGRPLFGLDAVRRFRVFIGHGIANAVVPLSLARRDFRLLYTAGASVRLFTYPTTHRICRDMLRDFNCWIMEQVNAENDALVID
ncbi:MAG TPA: hypothetical protein VIL46_05965 [Gemmataceae bacterium]